MKKKQQNNQEQEPLDNIFFNRELSWLEFNSRVLEEARCPEVPLFERLKFLTIFETNLDEFYMVRVAGMRRMLKEGIGTSESPDQLSIQETLLLIDKKVRYLNKTRHHALESIFAELQYNNIKIKKLSSLTDKQTKRLERYFEEEVYPVLTPLAVDPSHPFPSISNLALYLIVRFRETGRRGNFRIGFVEIPSLLPGLVKIGNDDEPCFFVEMREIIGTYLNKIFHYFQVADYSTFRVTRNLDYTLLENDVVDLLKSVQREMVNREQQEAVRLEIDHNADPHIINILTRNLNLKEAEVFKVQSALETSKFMEIYDLPFEKFRYRDFNPRLPSVLADNGGIFNILAKRDLLVHHPYESFYAVTEFLNAAAADKKVLAIKQTLYRTSGDSPIIETLIRAAENGIKVTAVIELKARFDEKNNIVWARRLERAGINVVFGFVGLKTHCKATLVVRREGDTLNRYVHLSTGNYNSQTAKIYTDLGLFTSESKMCKDISTLFNVLTGFNILSSSIDRSKSLLVPELSRISMSPTNLRGTLMAYIDSEIENHKKFGNGKIFAKMNALVDQLLIKKLYAASKIGVNIRLMVRGICCLRPGVPGLSENIVVKSIIDRFLEHSRAYVFHQNGRDVIFLGSADWMPRNMDRRIEIMFPILDPTIKDKLLHEIIPLYWSDNVKSRTLNQDGSYIKPVRDKADLPVRAQEKFISLVREEGVKSIPYEKAIRHDSSRKKGTQPIAKGQTRNWGRKKNG